jgi:prephenate dehydratase
MPSPERTPIEQWYGARKHAAPQTSPASAPPAPGQSAPFRVAIQGEPGSFSHQATTQLIGNAEIVPFSFSAGVFAALSEGAVDAAVIPIENSLAGSVSEHFDLLLAHDVKVEKETLLRIHHNLIALPGVSIREIQRVFSHPVALAQCRRFLTDHPQMEPFAFYDTAGSVKQLVELRDRAAAAIASEAAARYYGAEILKAGIEDNAENFTRFFLVRRTQDAETDPQANKLSLAFSLEHRPGSLAAALAELAAIGTNLTKIESRPVHGRPWEYVFYVDCLIGSPEEGSRAVAALMPHCSMVKELGRYGEARP